MKVLNWNDLAELGLIYRINKEILHPLGLAMSRNVDSGLSEEIFVAPDGFFEYSQDIHEKNKNPLCKHKIQCRIKEMSSRYKPQADN